MEMTTYINLVLIIDAVGLYIHVIAAWYLVRRNFKNRGVDYFICIVVATAIAEGIKSFINSPRPPYPLFGLTYEGSAFPSTHTSISFAVAFFYLFNSINHKRLQKVKIKFNKKESTTIFSVFVIAFIISILRILVGAHYFIDILGGITVGFIAAFVIKNYDISLKKIR